MSGTTGGAAGDPRSLAALMPLCRTLAIEFTRADADLVVAALDWSPELCTAGGVLHGGALMALADSAGAACAYLNLPPDSTGTTTVTSHTSFLAGVREGRVVASGRPVRVGRAAVFVEVEVTDGDGRPVARTSAVQLVLR